MFPSEVQVIIVDDSRGSQHVKRNSSQQQSSFEVLLQDNVSNAYHSYGSLFSNSVGSLPIEEGDSFEEDDDESFMEDDDDDEEEDPGDDAHEDPFYAMKGAKPVLIVGLFALLMACIVLQSEQKGDYNQHANSSQLPRLGAPAPRQTLMAGPGATDALVDGFLSGNIALTDRSNDGGDNIDGPPQLHWYCAPDSWVPMDGKREGRGGSWSVDDTDESLTVTPPAKKDYWRKTYYEPVLIKDDAPFLYAILATEKFFTVETTLQLTAVRQFDQAGIMIRLGPEHWLKAGIEVVDHQPRLSSVVTNSFSDWSTQPWSDYTVERRPDDHEITTVHVTCQIRVHCRGNSFVVEAKMPSPGEWQFIRIAHLAKKKSVGSRLSGNSADGADATLKDATPRAGTLWAGVFAASPEDQQGGHVTFTDFRIREGSHFEHNADGNQEL